MFICLGCQMTDVDGKERPTPCFGLQCKNDCECRPTELCDKVKLRIHKEEGKGNRCDEHKLDILLSIHCGCKEVNIKTGKKKCFGCLNIPSVKALFNANGGASLNE